MICTCCNTYKTIIFIPTSITGSYSRSFADEKQREIENEAINLVIKKYGKGLENRLKGTGLKPNYRSWYENDCFVSIAAGTYQEDTWSWSAIKWFSVNVCSESAEIMESE